MIKTFARQNVNFKNNVLKTCSISALKAVEYVASSSGGASITSLSLPSNTQPGDLVIFLQGSDNTNAAVVAPTDFTELFKVGSGTSLTSLGDMSVIIAYRIMPDPLPANIAGIASITASLCMAVTLRNTSNPPNLMLNVSSSTKGNKINDNRTGAAESFALQEFTFPDGISLTGFLQDDDIVTSFISTPSGYTVAVGPVTGGASGAGLSGGIGYKTTSTYSHADVGIWDTAISGSSVTDTWFSFSIGVGPQTI